MLLLEQNITRKEQIKIFIESNKGNNKEYEVEIIYNSTIYAKESEKKHLSNFYYLVLWESYPKKNPRKIALIMLYFDKLISTFHYCYSEKLTASFLPIIFFLPMARLIIRLIIRSKASNIKKKYSQSAKTSDTNKYMKKKLNF